MQIILKFNNNESRLIDLGNGNDLEKFDHTVSTIRKNLENNADIQFQDGVMYKNEDLLSVEIVL